MTGMGTGDESHELARCGLRRRVPAPVFVEADEVMDGLGEGDDGGGEDAVGSPLVDDAGNVLGGGGGSVRGNDPGVGEHERVNDGEAGCVKNDGDDVAKTDPIRAGDVHACEENRDQHDENGREIDDAPDGRQGD